MDNGVSQQTITNNYDGIFSTPHQTSGFVVLSHEVSQATCNEAVTMFPQIKSNFNSVMPVSTCNNDTLIMAEQDQPLFPSFAQYATGSRGSPRTNASFWTTDPMIFVCLSQFIHNQTKALIYSWAMELQLRYKIPQSLLQSLFLLQPLRHQHK